MLHLISRPYAAASSPDAVERFVTSWLLPPSILFFWRALISLYAFVVIFIILGYDGSRTAGQTFSYFTVLGYWGLAFYFAVAAAHTASYWIRGKAWLQSWPSGLQWAHSCFYSSITTFPFVVTIVFWSALSYGALQNEFSTWSNISEHALNSVFAFSELIITRVDPSPWINLVVVLVLLGLYLALAEITYATQGWYVYIFLDPSWRGESVVAGACIGILIGTIIVFAVMRYIAVLRKWVVESKLHMGGKLSPKTANQGRGFVGNDEEIGTIPMQSMTEKGEDMGCTGSPYGSHSRY